MGFIEQYLLQLNTEKRRWRRAVVILTALSLIVALVTVWNLRMTGVTMANDATCGHVEHQHTAECVAETVLICGHELQEPSVETTDSEATEEVTDTTEETTEATEETTEATEETTEATEETTETTEAAGSGSTHVHTDACYATVYSCGLEEHIHKISCYSDPTADLETAEIWEETLPDDLGEYWSENLARIAASQVGVTESERNFILAEDGETRQGITRYGQWYGNPYGDWSAMFVSFCLNYAQVPTEAIPRSPGVYNMMQLCIEKEILSQPDAYVGLNGNLLFLDTDNNANADKILIVTAPEESVPEDGAEDLILTVGGDWDNAVAEVKIAGDDPRIVGYVPTAAVREAFLQSLPLYSINKNSNVYTVDMYALPVDYDGNRITELPVTSLGTLRVDSTTKKTVADLFDYDLGVTAFAAENTGSITITNATIDETYTVYKIFDATIKQSADGKTEAVAYTIEEDSQFFADLFGADGTTANTFFAYNPNTGSVTKKDGVNDSELTKYLTELVSGGTYTSAAAPVKAATEEVKFENLPYGYYLITSTLGSTVTINSNTPDVEVIDKNQEPGTEFDKQVQSGVDENGDPIWSDSNSANIGDKFSYRISFYATNYDGDKKIKYYSVHDEKGDAIWAEFDSFKVVVDGEELSRGYYLSQGGVNTGNWGFLGDWTGVEQDRENAQWYLVHLGYDSFRITIPWLENHTLTDVTNTEGTVTSYSLGFAENAASKYDSPALVEITYNVVVEANAAIGDTSHGNRFNKAYASWTSEHETGSNPPDEVTTYVYGLGLLKDDGATGVNLAGAKFRIYSDKECTVPVYVIPTDVDGVYIVDSLGKAIESASGTGKTTSRDLFEDYLIDYLKDEEGKPILQNNLVVSQVNGKLAVLGLAEGTYYLKEVEAPAGYNALTLPVELKVGEGTRAFVIFADENGNVADIQAEDGTFKEYTLNLTHTTVHNSKGVELPSTGGVGAFWLITIGTLVAIGFAVFLITNKKMSVYTD